MIKNYKNPIVKINKKNINSKNGKGKILKIKTKQQNQIFGFLFERRIQTEKKNKDSMTGLVNI